MKSYKTVGRLGRLTMKSCYASILHVRVDALFAIGG